MSQVAYFDRLVMNHQQSYDKSALSLNLNGGRSALSSRKRKFLKGDTPTALLQSPDLKCLTVSSPDLEKFIKQNNGFIPTPTVQNNPLIGEHNVGDQQEQENFARGFIEALQKLHQEDDGTNVSTAQTTQANKPTWETISRMTTYASPPPSYQPPTTTNSQKWGQSQQVDHNLNTVPVITPNGSRHFDNRTPPINLINYPTATTGSVTSMGLTSLPTKSNMFMTKPQMPLQQLERPSSTHSMTHELPSYPSPNPSLLSEIKTEDEQMPPSVGSSNLNLEMNPIDLDAQEQIKHQRKKLRNRLAAQRCRKRKIEREETLKIKVKDLKNKNAELTGIASKLRMQVCELKQQVMHHVNEGCQVFYKDEAEKS